MNLKSNLERALQFAFSGISAYIAVRIIGAGPDYQIAIPIGVLLLYLVLTFGLIVIRVLYVKLFDRKAIVTGQPYFSVHEVSSPTLPKAGILRIKYSRWTNEYVLQGTTLQVNNANAEPIGSWKSTYININTDDHRISYLYTGRERVLKRLGPQGVGYATIGFNDSKFSTGDGYFVDDAQSTPRMDAHYTRLEPDKIEKVMGVRRGRTIFGRTKIIQDLAPEDYPEFVWKYFSASARPF
jgi:hypothetical protein